MPFDNRTFTETTKPDVLTVEALAAWLAKQDPATEYDYGNIEDCLLCRYGRAIGLDVMSAGGSYIRTAVGEAGEHHIPGVFVVVGRAPYTYGAAHKRAIARLAKRPA